MPLSLSLSLSLSHTHTHTQDTVSVHKPGFYSNRFLSFMSERVFQPLKAGAGAALQAPLVAVPSSTVRPGRAMTAGSSAALAASSASFRRHHRLSSSSPDRTTASASAAIAPAAGGAGISTGSPRYSRRKLAVHDAYRSEDSDAEVGYHRTRGSPSPAPLDHGRPSIASTGRVIAVAPASAPDESTFDDSLVSLPASPSRGRRKEEIVVVVTSPSKRELLPHVDGSDLMPVVASARADGALAHSEVELGLGGDPQGEESEDSASPGPGPEDDMSFV